MPSGLTTVLGIDPGVSETGWAVLRAADGPQPRLAASGIIRTQPATALPERLRLIHEAVSGLIARHRPDAAAIEEMFFLKAAHTIRGTLQARGVVLLAAAQARIHISEYNPRTVKATLTGSGTADKAQMQRVVSKTLGLDDLLRPDDVADAAAIGLCHLRSSRIKRLRVLECYGAASGGGR
ncbi:MAG TPA: crossover junction endodeoxyribonuclease RuvC [Elusimicrobia bacterium]|nr:crossover junction endodeoxyribonuclease RuvC [Elusimicrobiota bacterium]HBT62492.1 crossover junction endodeoxyribonuclease RuvC [Elusimicrobiota bacterium]